MARDGGVDGEGFERCTPRPRPVPFFPDSEDILGVWRNALMSTEASVGSIGHRTERGPEVGIQNRDDEGKAGAVGVAIGPDSTAGLRALARMASVGTLPPTEPPLLRKERQV